MLLTTQQAADKLGLTRARIIQLIIDGEIKATKFGKVYQIDEQDLVKASWNRKPGPKGKRS